MRPRDLDLVLLVILQEAVEAADPGECDRVARLEAVAALVLEDLDHGGIRGEDVLDLRRGGILAW